MLWLALLFVAVLGYLVWHRREGLTTDAYSMSQVHQGEISVLNRNFNTITMNESDIKQKVDSVKKNKELIMDLMSNMKSDVTKEYPMG